MTTVTMGSRMQLSDKIIGLMHEFRSEVFLKRLRWSLPVEDGVERDEYDTSDAKYVVVTNSREEVIASARMLPTTGAYMLPELFPQLLAGQPAPRDSSLWELSRFATSVRTAGDGRVLSLSDQTLDLLQSVFSLARRHDVSRLILVTSIGIERLMLRAGLDAHRFGPPASVGGQLCVALIIEVPSDGQPPAPCESTRARETAHQRPGL